MNKPPKKKFNKHVLKRVVKTLFEFYPLLLPVTIFCILFAAASAAIPDIVIQKVMAVIDNWFHTGDWNGASKEILPKVLFLVVLYIISLIAAVLYSQLTAIMTQGFLNKLRCKMFDGMQNLPLKFFDTNKHGDIMSYYTNDIDAIRQLISQSLPSLIRAGAIVISVFS